MEPSSKRGQYVSCCYKMIPVAASSLQGLKSKVEHSCRVEKDGKVSGQEAGKKFSGVRLIHAEARGYVAQGQSMTVANEEPAIELVTVPREPKSCKE